MSVKKGNESCSDPNLMALHIFDNMQNYLQGNREYVRAQLGLTISAHKVAAIRLGSLIANTEFSHSQDLGIKDLEWENHKYRYSRAIIAQHGDREIVQVTHSEYQTETEQYMPMHLEYVGQLIVSEAVSLTDSI